MGKKRLLNRDGKPATIKGLPVYQSDLLGEVPEEVVMVPLEMLSHVGMPANQPEVREAVEERRKNG
jgi:hypothetical protein